MNCRLLLAGFLFTLAASAAAQTLPRVAFIVIGSPALFVGRTELAEIALKHRLSTVMGELAYVQVGGLMSYGIDVPHNFRRAAEYVDKILKGAKPGELPMEQPTKFEMVVNLRTAKALDITIPQSVLLRADRMIE